VLSVINAAEILAERPFFPGMASTRSAGTVSSRFLTMAPGNAGTPDSPQIIFHICGFNTQGITDGLPLFRFGFHHHDSSTARSEAGWNGSDSQPEEWLVYCGTYSYVDTRGAKRTVPSYAVYRPATREEFVEALTSGVVLMDYVTERKTIRPPKGSKEKPQSVTEVVARPVP
jgi:hypothetical protein